MQSVKYSRDNAGQSLKKYILLKQGELAYNHGASKAKQFGCCYELTEPEARIPYVYHCFKVSDTEYTPFVAATLNNPKMDKQLKRLVSSSVRMDGLLNISFDDYMSVSLHLPSFAEQEKIADFLKKLDERITAQETLVASLKKYKRGVLQKLLDGNQGWTDVPLYKILHERKTYCEKDGSYEHVTLSKEGVYGKTERYDRDYLVTDESKQYKITKFGDLCYNPANLKFGVICLNTYGDAIFSPIYVTFEIDKAYDTYFIGQALTRHNFIGRALRYQQGTVYERTAVSPEDLLSMKISIPSLSVQRKVSNFLIKVDSKILIEQNLLNNIILQKKQLLKDLFI